MPGPVLIGAIHNDVTNLLDVEFDLPVSCSDYRPGSALRPVYWILWDLGAGIPHPTIQLVDVAAVDGTHLRLTMTGGALTPADAYEIRCSGSVLGIDGLPVGGGAGSAFAFLGQVLLPPGVLVELPSLFLGRVTGSTEPAAPLVLNETPESNYPYAAKDTLISVEIVDPDGAGIHLPSTVIEVDGATAFDNGVFGAGFQGAGSWYEAVGHRLFVVIDREADWTQGQDVEVEIETANLAHVPTNYVWRFRVADELGPRITSVIAQGLQTIHVTMSEAVKATDPTAVDDALNTGNWSIRGIPAMYDERCIPSVPVFVSSVLALSAVKFELTLDVPMTPDGFYEVRCREIVDVAWPVPNEVQQVPTSEFNIALAALLGDGVELPVSISGVVLMLRGLPLQAPGRVPHWNLFLLMPQVDRENDSTSGDLRRWLGVCQDLIDIFLLLLDNFRQVDDPDIAPEEWLDLMLADMGNPFSALDLDLDKKRAMAGVLWTMYSLKGSSEGIETAVRFLFDLDPVTVIPFWPTTGILGSFGGDAGVGDGSELGNDFLLGPSDEWALRSFNLQVPVILTDAEQAKIRKVVNWMKAAQEHFMDFVMPELPEVIDHWELGLSELDTEADLH